MLAGVRGLERRPALLPVAAIGNTGLMDQPLVFASGKRPRACHHGHAWDQGGTFQLSWVVCDCEASGRNFWGHHRIRCRGENDACRSVWLDPPCDHVRQATRADVTRPR